MRPRLHQLATVISAALLAGATVCASPSSAQDLTLEGKGFRAALSSRDGRLTSLRRTGGREMLHRPVTVAVRDEVSARAEVLGAPLEEFRRLPTSVSFVQRAADFTVESRFATGDGLSLKLQLRNHTGVRRDLSVLLDLGGVAADALAFLPSTYAHPEPAAGPELLYGYRTDGLPLVIPAVVFYSQSAGTGLTVLSPLIPPIQGFQVKLRPGRGVEVARVELRLEPYSSVSTEVLLALHEPDWRPGLAYIRSKYPADFTAHNPDAVAMNGPFLWSPTAAEEQVRQWHDQGVRWVEVHFTYPFLGQYVPSEPRWTPAMDDHWAWEKVRQSPEVPALQAPFALIQNYLQERLTPWETPERVRDFIRLLHRYQIKALMYFQPSECWEPYAAQRFMSDAVRDRQGELVPAWYEDIVLNPRPDSAWAQYLEEQFKGLLALYAEADGIFEDESHYDLLDYAHDDGFSIDKGRTAYRMGYAICLLISKLTEYAHSLGKTVWWNGPYQIELGSIGDGHLAEGSDEYIQWLGIGNAPITSGAWTPELYDRMLLIGSQPASPSLTPVSFPYRYAREVPADPKIRDPQTRDFERYTPLFQQIQSRELVLTANAVTVPNGYEANVFKRPDGNYAVPVITSWAGNNSGITIDLPLTVRVPDASSIRSIYLISSDCSGWFNIPWKFLGNRLEITIPRHGRASMLVLAKRGFYASIDARQMATIDEHPSGIELVLDNLSDSLLEGTARIGSSGQNFEVPGYGSRSLVVPAEGWEPQDSRRLAVLISIQFKNDWDEGKLSLSQQIYRVDQLEIGWQRTPVAYMGERSAVTVYLVNHSKATECVGFHAEGTAVDVTGLPASLLLPTEGKQYLPLEVRPKSSGQAEMRFTATVLGSDYTASLTLPVWRTRFSRLADAVVGWIEFEELVRDGMPDMRRGEADVFAPSLDEGFGASLREPSGPLPRPVQVNGQTIGYLPSLNQQRWRDISVAVPRQVLWDLDRRLQVSFAPANKHDDYQLRNIRLVLRLANGNELSTLVESHQFSTRAPGQGESQPIQVTLVFPKMEGAN